MIRKVAIVGTGYIGCFPTSPSLSYKEMMFEAASKAYADAGIDPRKDADGFVCVSEDFHEGTSIFDEYVPDQIGAYMKPVHTIAGDGIQGLIAAFLKIQTGLMDIVVVEAHSKASNMMFPEHITSLALDPIFNRPVLKNVNSIAAMEMRRYMYERKISLEVLAKVVVKNKLNALKNPSAAYPAYVDADEILAAERCFDPLSSWDKALYADGAFVVVVASEEAAKRLKGKPVWIRGVGWCTETPSLETKDWVNAVYAEAAAKMAYRMAGIKNPAKEIDFAEVDDSFSYKELQHMEAMGLCRKGEAGYLVMEGETAIDGRIPVNPSGGSLGVGNLLDATGLMRIVEAVGQLRREAGRRQVEKAETAVVQSWRGIPTTTGAVVVLGI